MDRKPGDAGNDIGCQTLLTVIAAGMKEVDLLPSDSELKLDELAQTVAESAPHQAEVHSNSSVADQARSILGSSYYRPEQDPK